MAPCQFGFQTKAKCFGPLVVCLVVGGAFAARKQLGKVTSPALAHILQYSSKVYQTSGRRAFERPSFPTVECFLVLPCEWIVLVFGVTLVALVDTDSTGVGVDGSNRRTNSEAGRSQLSLEGGQTAEGEEEGVHVYVPSLHVGSAVGPQAPPRR